MKTKHGDTIKELCYVRFIMLLLWRGMWRYHGQEQEVLNRGVAGPEAHQGHHPRQRYIGGLD